MTDCAAPRHDELRRQCADLAAWLPAAEALITQPDQDGTTSGGEPATRPPWNGAAAAALLDAHEGVRRLEASLRWAVNGHYGRRRGGSAANTGAALKAVEALAHAVDDYAAADAARILEHWSRRIRELPAVDDAEPWRRIPARCPYCGCTMLRVKSRSGEVTCLRYGACFDADGHHPVGRMDMSAVTGEPLIRWADGLVAP